MTVIGPFKVAFSNNCIGYKLMRVKYIFATAAKSLICSAAEAEAEAAEGAGVHCTYIFKIIDRIEQDFPEMPEGHLLF